MLGHNSVLIDDFALNPTLLYTIFFRRRRYIFKNRNFGFIMADFSIWEVLFLLCFAVSWPVSIAKSLRTKVVIGKSPFFMSLVILGYIFGIIHKALYSHDIVIWLYVFNALLVATDLSLYFTYIGRNRRDLQQGKKD